MAGADVLGAESLRPGLGIAGADVEELALGVVGDAVPHRAAAAELPPIAVPSRGGLAHGGVFKALRGIAGDGPEAPGFAAGLGVIGGEEAARGTVAARRSHDHLSLGDARRHG